MEFTTELDSTSYGGMLDFENAVTFSEDGPIGLDIVPKHEELESLVRCFSGFLIRIDHLRKMAGDAQQEVETDVVTGFRDTLTELLEETRAVREPMLQAILTEENPLLNTANSEAYHSRGLATRTLDDIMAEFMRLRWRQASIVTALPASDFARMGRHPFYGDISLAGLIAIFVDQDEAHLKRLKLDSLIASELVM